MPTVHSLYLQKEECAEHLEERIGFPHSLNLIPFICYKVRPPDAHGDSGTPDTALTWGERKRVNTLLLHPARQQQDLGTNTDFSYLRQL